MRSSGFQGKVCLRGWLLLSVGFLCSLTGWIRSHIIQFSTEIGENRRVFGSISKITEQIVKDAKSSFLLLDPVQEKFPTGNHYEYQIGLLLMEYQPRSTTSPVQR